MKIKLFKFYQLAIIVLALVNVNSYANIYADKYPPVTISNSQAISFTSNINQTNYEIQISLPDHYHESDMRYPVVYLLDANNDFPLVTSISRRLHKEDNLQPIIIIGIGYKKDANINRLADYTPTKFALTRAKITGQADKFLQVIKHEIIPVIDSTYKTQTDNRTIAGHSVGGLFGAYQIIKEKNLFSRYIISSASLWWDDFKTLSFEQNSYQKPIEAYISVGSEEGEHMKKSATKLITFIESKIAKAKIKTAVLDGETHGSAKFRAYSDSLRWLFKENP